MKFFFVITSKSILLLVLPILTIHHSSADFFRDPRAIPPTFNATRGGAWDNFYKFSGFHIGQSVEGLSTLKTYFHKFGYIPTLPVAGNFSDDFDESLDSAVRLYQQNFRLKVTGELNDQTLRRIIQPRCGVADIINGSNTMATKTTPSLRAVAHYSFFEGQPRWPSNKKFLTYGFRPENTLSDSVKRVFKCAFARWSAVIPLTFNETDNYYEADITIGFYSGEHGDEDSFDGVLDTLGHTFAPTNGRLHLDNDETWVVEGDVTKSSVWNAVDLQSVVVHEIGHALGLGHTSVEDAIMFPTIHARKRKVKLVHDDIQGIQAIYGSYHSSGGEFKDVCGSAGLGLLLQRSTSFWGVVVVVGVSIFFI